MFTFLQCNNTWRLKEQNKVVKLGKPDERLFSKPFSQIDDVKCRLLKTVVSHKLTVSQQIRGNGISCVM